MADPLTREEAEVEIGKLVSAEYSTADEVRAAMKKARDILSRVKNVEERAILAMPLESLAMLQMSLQHISE